MTACKALRLRRGDSGCLSYNKTVQVQSCLCQHWPLLLTGGACPAAQLFPYHLADYVCRVLRVTPFRYYCDLLFTVMRDEKSYDQIPNFTVLVLRRALLAQRLPVLWNVTTAHARTTYRGCPAWLISVNAPPSAMSTA